MVKKAKLNKLATDKMIAQHAWGLREYCLPINMTLIKTNQN